MISAVPTIVQFILFQIVLDLNIFKQTYFQSVFYLSIKLMK